MTAVATVAGAERNARVDHDRPYDRRAADAAPLRCHFDYARGVRVSSSPAVSLMRTGVM